MQFCLGRILAIIFLLSAGAVGAAQSGRVKSPPAPDSKGGNTTSAAPTTEKGDAVEPVFDFREVTRKAVILKKPSPGYTKAAKKHRVVGTVVLRAVLTSRGTVERITVLKELPDGLTEKSVEAAKKIKFTPAEKDGKPASQWVTLEYIFAI